MLVSENNTSYGKDLGDIRLLETLLPELAAVEGIARVRVSYLQPAEMRPGLIDALTSTPGVVPYFDLSFQHSAPGVLRAMRRFGDTDRFLDLLDAIRAKAPEAGVRSNFIVGFPGESEDDLAELERFLSAGPARRHRRVRLLRRGRHRGRVVRRQAGRGRGRGPAGPGLAARRGADRAARRGAAREHGPGAGRGGGRGDRGGHRPRRPPGARDGRAGRARSGGGSEAAGTGAGSGDAGGGGSWAGRAGRRRSGRSSPRR